MNLQCRHELGSAYTSASQVARVLTEDWCTRELYCPACASSRLSASKVNTPALDFSCPECEQLFQLKGLKKWNPKKIVDAGYEAMIRSIRADRIPNLLILQYSREWSIQNLMVIPRVFFSESVIEQRPPLGPEARRAGWVGCNILLSQIPEDGKINIVSAGMEVPQRHVRDEYSRIKKLAELPPSLRGWTVDVLKIIRELRKPSFSLQDLYRFESELKNLHPRNQNVRPKIRQQLQVLRDLGLLEFASPGNYILK
jgi:type II restriction enzyme